MYKVQLMFIFLFRLFLSLVYLNLFSFCPFFEDEGRNVYYLTLNKTFSVV